MTGIGVEQVYCPETAPRRRNRPRLHLFLVGLAMAAGAVVLIEPAPIDIALMLLLASGVLLNKLEFRYVHTLPMILVGVVAAANGRPKGLFKYPNVYRPYRVPVTMYAIANLHGRGNRTAMKLFWLSICLIAPLPFSSAFLVRAG